ncbi:hypothetical protein Tco_1427693 [Tanacetum coccineum]
MLWGVCKCPVFVLVTGNHSRKFVHSGSGVQVSLHVPGIALKKDHSSEDCSECSDSGIRSVQIEESKEHQYLCHDLPSQFRGKDGCLFGRR